MAGCGSADEATTTSTAAAVTDTSVAVQVQIDEELIGVWLPLDAGNEAALEFKADGRMLILSGDASQEPIEAHYRAEDGRIILVNHLGVDEVRAPYCIEDGILSITDADTGIVETYRR